MALVSAKTHEGLYKTYNPSWQNKDKNGIGECEGGNMELKAFKSADVIVMGSGIAGLIAAIEAAKKGVSVCLVSSGPICSGSSFYPGTWGLGLIGPENDVDKKDLEQTIKNVGEGMADSLLVHTFVEGISGGISYLEELGLKLKQAADGSEREFIPCFDHKSRAWNGIIQKDAKEVLAGWLTRLNVFCLPGREVIDLVVKEGLVKGVVTLEPDGTFRFLSCRALVIASGGMGGLFRYRLNTDDIAGMGQYLALKSGSKLINIEFMQMMPGFLRPAPKTIFNEKIFRYSEFRYPDREEDIFGDLPEKIRQELLEIRSGHGPFTSRLESCQIDQRLFSLFSKDERGARVRYRKEIWENQPEFVRTYFEWLSSEKHLTVQDEVQIGIFAHASNGGIRIDSRANAGLPNLFACGEVTGGMHGADRLGGLSTANGLVFGRIAGCEAADIISCQSQMVDRIDFYPQVCEKAAHYLEILREANFKGAMTNRHQQTAKEIITKIKEVESQLIHETRYQRPEEQVPVTVLRDTYQLKAASVLSQCLAQAILLRKESRGSHCRLDYPKKDSHCERNILCSYDKDIHVSYQ